MPFLRFHKIGKERTMNIKFFNAAKRDAVTRFLAPVAVAFFSVLLASCPNSADNVPFVLPAQQTVSSAPTVSAGGTAANAEAQFITFRGSVRTGGALPASYAKALEDLGFGGTEEGVEGISKSARPDVTVNGISIEHFAVATPNVGEPVEGTFASASSTTFEMPLAIGKTWNIVCGIRNVSGDKKIIMSDSFQMEVTVSNSVLSHVFMLTPYTEVVEGAAPSGNVSLLVNFEGSAASVGASVSASWEDPALPALTVEGLDPAHITASGVPVGNHRLAIFFRDPNGVSVYETVQVVTVLNGLTTETWMPETGEAAFTSGGHFVVDNDVIQGAASDRIYVGKPAALASNDSVRASDSNSGSAYSPLEHLQAAFNKIQSAGSGSKDFKIFVSGEAVGNATLDVVRGTHARSITIEGLDDPDESLKPKSAIKGSGSGSVFTIASNVPVTIKNLKITGGSGAGQGGGISMASGSDLTLDSGALVTQNSATQQGGGVYNRDGSLKIKKGAAISGNWITSAGSSGSDGGAGLFMYGSSAACVMTGGEISDNNKNASYNDKNVRGGGVRLGGSARMTLSGGSVSGNFSKNLGGNFFIDNAFLDISGDAKICQGCVDTSSNTSDDNAWGGALYVEGNSKVTMTGGEISGNTAKAKNSKYACAGVYLLKEFEMTGGVIEGNVVEGGLSSGGAFRVGGLLTIGGSAKIPYGGGEGKNDVYVCKDGEAYKVVQVAASGFSYAASDCAPAAVLAPEGWQRNYAIIKAPSGSDIGAYTPYFKTIDPDFYFGKLSGTVDTAKLKAALCVSNKASAADNDEQSGTKSQPFRTIEFALTKLSAGEPDEIIIDYDSNGAAFGPQKIPSSFIPAKCSALTIRGANGLYTSGANQGEPKDILDAGGTENVGSALSIASAVPITIKDLKITGGNKGYISGDNPNSGGGVSLFENASLTLADGVQIAGNKASNSGGGVYVPSGASLYMYGTSCIGDNTQTTASGDALGSACSNSAPYGGGIYNDGKVYLGYKNEGGEIKEAEWTGGVRRNYASTYGGGIYCYSNGDLKMRAGKISYNASRASYWGGGLSVASNASDGHSVELLGGEIKENSAGLGGAVYVNGAFSMQGALSIPFGVAGAKGSGKNDIFLADGKTVEVAGALSSPDGETMVATLTPDVSKRKRKILSASSEALINDNKDKFALVSDNDGWQKNYVSDSGHYAELNSPVYVVGTESSGSIRPDDTWGWGNLYNAPNGTKTSPYASVAAALGCAELASATEPNTIIIAGTLKGAQTISGTSVPSELSLKGYKASGASSKINAGSAGSALTVNKSGLTVTITDLIITGGIGSDLSGGTAKNGGGIYLNAGSVKLSDGAVITGNTVEDNGGGVYLAASGCALYMSGKALIGDSATSTTRASSAASNRANQAGNGAGIYNNGGSVFIGSNASGTATGFALVNNDTDGHYGVRRNYSTSHGAGIYHAAGTLKIASGDISCNSGSSYSNGGGIYFAAGASIGGGTFSNGYAKNGGGLYIKSGVEVTVSGGAKFTQNEAASTGNGGAIYQGGTFNMSGSAYIAPGSERSNDVYLASGKTVAITGALTPSSGVTAVATITPDSYSRGRDILSSDSANKTNLSDAIGKFKLSQDDSGWDRGNNLTTSDTAKRVWITSPIYVAGASGGAVCSAPPSDATKATGTKKMPYATIAAALKDTDLAYESNTITIDGTLSAQTIANTDTVADEVSAVTLQGYKASGAATSAAAINGGGTSNALSINKALTYTIKDLQITNGKASSGGGINIGAASAVVNLDSGAKVSGNKASSSGTGAGVYVASGATLNIKSGSEIYSNVADSGNINGGGVYNLGTVNIYSGSKLYKNTANYGGAIYNKGTLSMSGGTIGGSAANANTAAWGGGIYNDASKSLIISGGELSYNSATNGAALGNAYGGAIMNYGSLTISGAATISNNTASETNTSQGYAYGGGIYNASSGSVEITGALTMNANIATVAAATSGQSTSQGGAIYNAGTLTMSKGTIGASGKLNTVTGKSVTVLQGGAIYQNGTFNISGTAYVYPGTKTSNDVCLPSGKFVKVVNSWTGSQASSKMALTPATWKRGTQVLDGDYAAAYYTYFKTTDTEWSVGYKETSWALTGDLKKCIGADIYVAGAGCASGITAPSSTASERVGTKAKPFNSISEGVNACWNTGLPFTINFSGTISGTAQTIPAATATTGLASAITIQGVTGNTSDIIDRNLTATSSSTGTALTINSTTSVTLKNIKITKGYSSTNGGGITVNTGASLTLGEGVSITANKATSNGGGIYSVGTVDMTSGSVTNNSAQNGGGIYSSGTLYVRGSAIVGDKTETPATGSTAGTYCSNSASASGGGIYNSGTLYFGCNTSGTKDADNGYALDSGYGVRRNYANDGGGIYNTGTFKSGSGSISYNYAPNSAGGLYAGGSTNNMGGLGVSYNKTGKNGAGVYVASSKSAEVTAQSGVNHNTATVSSGSSDVCGGGIYVAGTLTTTETLNANWNSASITGGSGKAYGGCVYIASGGKFVYSKGQLGGTSQSNTVSNTVSGSTDKAYGGSVYQGGTFEVSANGYIPKGSLRSDDVYLPSEKYITVTGELKTNSNLSQMTITPATWKRGTKVLARGSSLSVDVFKNQIAKFKGSETDWLAVYNSSVGKLYTSYKIYVSQSGYDDDKNGIGTSAKPYKTISKAVGECWTTSYDFTVYVSGTIKGAHTIGGTDVTINAKSLTLEGTGTSPTIDAEKTSGIRPLTINTSLGVTIKNLTITNGNVTSNYGGGIYVEGSCALTLDDGASVLSNKASSGGGGVYVDADSTLIMKSGSTINKNVGSGPGGGVYNKGKVLMSGTARIGANGTSKPGTSSTSPTGNYTGLQGGGIYNAGTVCLGYTAWTNETTNTPKKLEGGVTQNYAKEISGGIYVNTAAKVYMKTGNISYNRANNGGGMTNATGTVKLLGGKMESNWADSNKSGAIWQNGDLYLGGDVYIPYGGSLGLNDLYLNDKSVLLNTDIAPPEDCTTGVIATIYPKTYAGIGVVGQNYAYAPCLAVVPEPGTTPPQAWTINTTNGYLKKTTAITSSNISSVVSGLSSGAELKADSTFGNDALASLKTALGSTSNTIKLDLSQSSVTSLSDATKIPSCLESIVLPNNFAAYGLLWQGLRSNSNLKTIEVSPQNKKLASDSGILYGLDDNGNKVRLVLYPASKTGSSYTLPSGVITLGGGCFWGNKNLTSITNLTQITQIDNYGNQFRLCEKITSINLTNVTTTGDYGYGFIKGCSALTTVTLASTLTTLEGNCFSECRNLTTIHFKSTTPPTINSSDPKLFSDCNASLKIYVPSSSRSAWLSATGTYGFANSDYNALAGSLNSKVYGE